MWSKLHLHPFHVISECIMTTFQFDAEKWIPILNRIQAIQSKQLYHLKGKFIC